jgi:hypothetical protein
MSYLQTVKREAIQRHRRAAFGELSLKLFETTPETGETEVAELTVDWCGSRTQSTTDGANQVDAGTWEFEIWATDDWQTSQAFMQRIVALKIGDRRWKVKKVEKPIGETKYWRVMATIQS